MPSWTQIRRRFDLDAMLLKGLTRDERAKAALLSAWFFVTVATLWLLKPLRVASLLVHLGAVETPYVRLAGVVTVAVVVTFYSWIVDRLTRVGVVRWAHLGFAGALFAFWLALRLWGAWLGAQRPFVYAVYILVEIYSVVLIGIFWTYANDIVSEKESNKLYGVIGAGGILGGAAGGAFVDAFTRRVGPVNLIVICAGLCVVSAALGSLTEARVRPPERRVIAAEKDDEGFSTALAGAREVRASRYLMLLVGIVVAYEFTATLTDFGISLVFERAFRDEVLMTQMYGRLGWIASATALVSQLVLVPVLLPHKRIALLVPPVVMLAGAVSLLAVPAVAAAMFLAASDRGLNYSVQQSTKESLYVPLSDVQKYKSKAFIDMFVDRAAKALAAFALIAIIQTVGASIAVTLSVSIVSMLVWAFAAYRLGIHWRRAGFINAPKPAPSEPLPPLEVAPAE
jgi:AAA family ATP:ADP antiporter